LKLQNGGILFQRKPKAPALRNSDFPWWGGASPARAPSCPKSISSARGGKGSRFSSQVSSFSEL